VSKNSGVPRCFPSFLAVLRCFRYSSKSPNILLTSARDNPALSRTLRTRAVQALLFLQKNLQALTIRVRSPRSVQYRHFRHEPPQFVTCRTNVHYCRQLLIHKCQVKANKATLCGRCGACRRRADHVAVLPGVQNLTNGPVGACATQIAGARSRPQSGHCLASPWGSQLGVGTGAKSSPSRSASSVGLSRRE
jgi:hypothetical protein